MKWRVRGSNPDTLSKHSCLCFCPRPPFHHSYVAHHCCCCCFIMDSTISWTLVYSLNKKEWICSLFKEWILEKSEIRVNLEWTFVLFTHFGVTSGITRNPWVIPVNIFTLFLFREYSTILWYYCPFKKYRMKHFKNIVGVLKRSSL